MTEQKESVTQIGKNIKVASSEGFASLHSEANKLFKLISSEIDKLVAISNKYSRLIEKAKTDYKVAKGVVDQLQKKRVALQEMEAETNKKKAKVDKEANELVEFHKVLESRRKSLDTREEDISNREKKAREKIVPPTR
jgi:DNA repair ATPase RecN